MKKVFTEKNVAENGKRKIEKSPYQIQAQTFKNGITDAFGTSRNTNVKRCIVKIPKTKKAGREKKEGYGQHINPLNHGFCKIKTLQWPCVNFHNKQSHKELHEIQIWIVNLGCFLSRSHTYNPFFLN